jgi:hypothetical protein
MDFEVGDIVIYNPNVLEGGAALLPALERLNDHCRISNVGDYYLTVIFMPDYQIKNMDSPHRILKTSISFIPNTIKYNKHLFKYTVLNDFMKFVISNYINKCWEYSTCTTATFGPCNIILQFLYA